VGNCCIGDEESQTLAAEHLDKLTRALQHDEILEVTAGTVANLYSGDVASLDQAVEIGLVEVLVTRLDSVKLDAPIIMRKSPVAGAVISFLSSAIEATLESGVLQPTVTKEFLQVMLQMPTDQDLDDDAREDSLSATLLLLKDDAIQQKIATIHEACTVEPPPHGYGLGDGFGGDPWLLTLMLYEITAHQITEVKGDDDAQTRAHCDFLESVLCDIACRFTFPNILHLTNDFTLNMMVRWAGTRLDHEILPNPRLQACAFLIMGNIARRKDICEMFVHQYSFHMDAIDLVKTPEKSDNAIRHSAAGFLRNLANAKENKQAILESEVVRHLIHGDNEARADGLRLLRVLARDEPDTCAMILTTDTGSSTDLGINMLSITDMLPEMETESNIEMGRLLVTILKTVQQNQLVLGSYDFLNGALVAAILGLVQNASGTPVASEGWLGLALSSVNAHGAKLVYQALRAEDPPFNSLNKTFQSSVDTGDQMEKLKDAENALVVVGQLVKNLVCCPHVINSDILFKLFLLNLHLQQGEDGIPVADRILLLEILKKNVVTQPAGQSSSSIVEKTTTLR
jgi:hypothetical protein